LRRINVDKTANNEFNVTIKRKRNEAIPNDSLFERLKPLFSNATALSAEVKQHQDNNLS
jgi:hypothetical protein